MLYRIQGIEDDEWDGQKDGIVAEFRELRDRLNPHKEKKPAAGKKGKKGKKEDEDEEDEEDD
jgi:hypothetical protein